jgi:glycosyltransferase involved in cell wall biosynthesis
MPDVSIVMPCLNERQALGHCVGVAHRALDVLRARHGLTGEIVVADNGSTDGSQQLARSLGARVVAVEARGYGAALRGGFVAARGRYLVMGDADGSYDFLEAVPMIEALMGGADICMGSRFKGEIAPGAMPWKNRYIGNPVLTGLLNLLFHCKVDDAHCGLRALTKTCFERLRLDGAGMEFASEMLIKAVLLDQRIAEVPVTLRPDLRGRAPHLRPWRDGWRHLRYLLMLSPFWLFGIPAGGLIAFAAALLTTMTAAFLIGAEITRFGNYWAVLAGSLLTLGHMGLVLALAGQLYGIRERYRSAPAWLAPLAPWLTLEAMLIAGLASMLAGLVVLVAVLAHWTAHNLAPIPSVLPAVLGTCALAIGMQNVLGGFLLAIVSGNSAEFLQSRPQVTKPRTPAMAQPARLPAETVGNT